MPKLYVAFTEQGNRLGSGSQTTLREKVRQFPDTVWSVFKYELKAGVETMVLLLEGDVTKWGQPAYLEHLRVNAQKQVRKFDPSKQQTVGS